MRGRRGRAPLLLALVAALVCVGASGVARDQGVPDSRASAGRLFRIDIPGDAFSGTVHSFEVTEAGENSLPSWLRFDAKSRALEGVPNTADIGQLYISIKATDGTTTATDVFSIEIVDDTSSDFCPFGKDETLASVIIDATLPGVSSAEKTNIVGTLGTFFGVPEKSFKFLALRREESTFDPGALRAGPGNALQRNNEGTLLRFRVGCGGEISPEFEPILARLEKSAASSELADLVGYSIVGWQVSSTATPILRDRDKRNVRPFSYLGATPIPEIHITRWPTFTERVEEAETREPVPEIRIVPTMSSPKVTDPSHKHRHQHGQDPLRRDHIFPTTELHASPTHHFHPFPTTRLEPGGTPLPTPILFPERPTTVILPTRVYEIDGTVSAVPPRPPHVSEDMLSRWYVTTSDFATVEIKPTRSHPIVEPTKTLSQTPNFKPVVNSRTKKLSLVAGKAWNYTIPIDTFTDIEDGNTRDLKLIFMNSGRTSLPSTSWIQFDPEHQVIYALPLSENIGRHEFVLEAMDSEGASTFDRVELNVWAHPQENNVTHSFEMIVRHNKWQFPVGIDWQIEVLSKLATLLEDRDSSKLAVLTITLDPVKIMWTNDSLPTEHCPHEIIQQIYDIIATPDHHPTKEMKKVMAPEFRVQDINLRYRGICHGVISTEQPPMNFPPKLSNPIRQINATVGDIIKFKIPDKTFHDFEDGSTRKLRLILLTSDNVQPHKTYWLQFDSRNQEIYGLVSEREVGRHDLLLSAVDSDDHTVTDSFLIKVDPLSMHKKPPVELSITLDSEFDDFQSDTSKKTLVASRIAKLYGDPDPRYMIITNISRGSVVYAWSNKTLGHDYCPKEKIDHLVKYIINEDGSLASSLVQIMEPEFRVTSADAVPTGVCLGGVPPTFVTITTTTPAPPPPDDELEPTQKTSTDDEIYVTTIIPAIVIAVILLVAAVVAYILYLKSQKGKMTSMGDKDFIGSGVPVVFAGELEEQRPDPGKAPAVLKNEKPPLTTDYLLNPFRRGMAGATATKTRDDPYLRERPDTASLYKPPPPFPSSREPKHSRPKNPQAYRHATYVPP